MKQNEKTLSAAERTFITRRTKFVRTWPEVGTVLLLGLLCFVGWLFVSNPLLINPFEVLERVKHDTLSHATLTLMAGLLPMFMLMCLLLVAAALMFTFVALANEKKYITMLERFGILEPAAGETVSSSEETDRT